MFQLRINYIAKPLREVKLFGEVKKEKTRMKTGGDRERERGVKENGGREGKSGGRVRKKRERDERVRTKG